MRVIGGTAKGRKLLSVPGDTTRPILDRVKTALFDILRFELENSYWLDLFAGTGNVGIEALSQGAKFCTFLDLEKQASEIIKQNLDLTGLSKQAEVRCTDAFRFVKSCHKSYDVIYIAPPQYKNIWFEMLQIIAGKPSLLNQDGKIIVQIDPKEYEDFISNSIKIYDERTYGNTQLLFFKKLS